MVDRFIAGTVNADGSVKHGSDFTVTQVSEGHYLVAFRPSFTQISGATATEIYDGDTRDNAVIIRLNNTELYVKVGDSGGNAKNRDFTFIAVGTGSTTARKE